MTDTGSHADTRDMYMVHTTFRREFGALPSLVRNVQAGDIQRPQTIGDHIDIWVSICMCITTAKTYTCGRSCSIVGREKLLRSSI
jgi:hypothetical protein